MKILKISCSWLLFLITFFGLGLFAKSSAYDFVSGKSTTVVASVPDREKPTPPILVSPLNNQLLNINLPEFVWLGSNDNVAVAFYRFWLDGAIFLSRIDPSEGFGNRFNFIPDRALVDGWHSWQVEAIDTSGNSNFSALWHFTIDTLAPKFIIEQIDQLIVSINALDNQNLFDQAFEVNSTQPILRGSGEPYSSVRLFVSIAGQQTIELAFEIDGNGQWQYQLPQLPVNTTVYLTFIIQDPAGNVSVIERLPLRVVLLSPNLLAKLQLTATPVGLTVQSNLKNWRGSLLAALPLPISQLLTLMGQNGLSNWLVLVWLVLSIILGLIYLITRQGHWPNFWQLKNFLWILSWIPLEKDEGLVFDPVKNQAFPLAKLTIFQIREEFGDKVAEIIANRRGRYQLPDLEIGEFKLDAEHKKGLFPCLKPRPKEGDWQNYYLGEKFKLKQKVHLPVYGVPMSAADQQKDHDQIPLLVEVGSWHGRTSLLINLPICLVLALLFPHPINFISLLLSLAVSFKHYR